MAGGFKKIAGKWGGAEYLILNFYLPMGHVKLNVQSIGDIISFRIYDTYFHHDVKCHATKKWACGLDFFFFFRFSYRFSLFSLFVSLFLFSLILRIYLIFLFQPRLFKNKVKIHFQDSIFQVFSVFESFWCLPSKCLRTDTMSMQGHPTGTYKEININRICE